MQDRALRVMVEQLLAVEVEDLPGLIRFLLSTVDKTNAEQVGLHATDNVTYPGIYRCCWIAMAECCVL